MLELIETYQLDIMLVLCAVCATMAGLLLVTGFLSRRRKWILILLELNATFLLLSTTDTGSQLQLAQPEAELVAGDAAIFGAIQRPVEGVTPRGPVQVAVYAVARLCLGDQLGDLCWEAIFPHRGIVRHDDQVAAQLAGVRQG